MKRILWGMVLFNAGVALADPSELEAFQRRAKTVEAKMALTALHTAEKIHQMDADAFTTDLGALESDLSDSLKRYAVGFVSPSGEKGGKTKPGRMMQDAGGVKDLTGKKPPPDWQKWCPKCTADASHFLAIAVGNVGTPEKPIWDVWTIDQDRELKHVVDGTTAP